jgi:hypothetical protein
MMRKFIKTKETGFMKAIPEKYNTMKQDLASSTLEVSIPKPSTRRSFMTIRHPSPCSLLVAVLLCMPLAAQATLISRLGGQAYYDTVLGITWLADANLAASTTFGLARSPDEFPDVGIGSTGRMNWPPANTWIAAMNTAEYLGFDDWRLPSALNQDSTGPCLGFCNGSELGYMFYENLGVSAGSSILTSISPNFALFNNIQSDDYWVGDVSSSSGAGLFNASIGDMNAVHFPNGNHFGASYFVWAVRDGDVGAATLVPESGTIALLCVGLIGLVCGRWREFGQRN